MKGALSLVEEKVSLYGLEASQSSVSLHEHWTVERGGDLIGTIDMHSMSLSPNDDRTDALRLYKSKRPKKRTFKGVGDGPFSKALKYISEL